MNGDLAGDPFQGPCPEGFRVEPAGEEVAGDVADDDRAGRRQRLQARGDVGGLPDDRERLPCDSGAHLARDHGSAVEPDPHLQGDAVALEQILVELLDAREDAHARVRSPQRVVLVRTGIAEVGEHTVSHPLGRKTLVALDRARTHALVGAQDLAEVLGVELLRERGGVDDVAEHHRHVPSFRLGLRPRLGRGHPQRQ